MLKGEARYRVMSYQGTMLTLNIEIEEVGLQGKTEGSSR
jgi:hypothetical protein